MNDALILNFIHEIYNQVFLFFALPVFVGDVNLRLWSIGNRSTQILQRSDKSI